jgi:hypothetical protein
MSSHQNPTFDDQVFLLSLSGVIEYFSYTTYVVIEGNVFELMLIPSNLA